MTFTILLIYFLAFLLIGFAAGVEFQKWMNRKITFPIFIQKLIGYKYWDSYNKFYNILGE